jgi:hypothetical protein
VGPFARVSSHASVSQSHCDHYARRHRVPGACPNQALRPLSCGEAVSLRSTPRSGSAGRDR